MSAYAAEQKTNTRKPTSEENVMKNSLMVLIKNINKMFYFSFYLQSVKLLGLIAGNLCVDHLGEKEFSQL